MNKSKPAPKVLFLQLPHRQEVSIPLDLATMIPNITKLHCDIAVEDLQFPRNILNILTGYAPDCIVMSAYSVAPLVSQRDWLPALEAIRLIRINSNSPLVLTHRHPVPEFVTHALRRHSIRIITGDLEISVPGILSDLLNLSVQRISEITCFPVPNYDFFPLHRYPTSLVSGRRRALPIHTSRGCNSRCPYCYVKCGYRPRAADAVAHEIRQLQSSHNVNHFVIEDDCFNHSENRVADLCDFFRATNLEFSWECLNGLDPSRLSPETLAKMRLTGCEHIALGIEAPDLRIAWTKTLSLVFHAKTLNMFVTGYFLIDKLSGFRDLLKIRSSPIDFVHFSALTPSKQNRAFLLFAYFACYFSARRLTTLFKLRTFSSEKFLRLLSRMRRW